MHLIIMQFSCCITNNVQDDCTHLYEVLDLPGCCYSPPVKLLCNAGSPSPTAVQQALPEASSCSSEATPLTNGQPVEAEEGRDIGHVKWPVYVAYMKAVGAGMVAFVLLSITLMQVFPCWLEYMACNVCLTLVFLCLSCQ